MTVKGLFFGFTCLVLVLGLVPTMLATKAADPPVTLHVPTAEYPTIQSAIDAASDGDTVMVADGIYAGIGNRDLVETLEMYIEKYD